MEDHRPILLTIAEIRLALPVVFATCRFRGRIKAGNPGMDDGKVVGYTNLALFFDH